MRLKVEIRTPVLKGVPCRRSSYETEKLIWLEKFARILIQIHIYWSGVVVIAGDFNIDF